LIENFKLNGKSGEKNKTFFLLQFVSFGLFSQLNAEIAKLQAMQHKYSLLEFESTRSFLLSQVSTAMRFFLFSDLFHWSRF
jgi:hypothetical protein